MLKKVKALMLICMVIILVSGMSIYAAYNYFAKDIKYTKSNGTEISVESALNELYSRNGGSGADLVGTVWEFYYTGKETLFVVPCSGKYKLEVWGAQGATSSSTLYGGYGGYSVGEITLNHKTKLYINPGGQGSGLTGGYNGGANGNNRSVSFAGGGGGASHIAYKSGELKNLVDDKDDILIVAGGGAGAYSYSGHAWNGNHGGGYIGGHSNGDSAGKQDTGYAFGTGGSTLTSSTNYSGGGGGYYGGYSWYGEVGSGGGSGYIGNKSLSNKHMSIYSGDKSLEDEDTLTNTVGVQSSQPESDKAKAGHGHIRITLME